MFKFIQKQLKNKKGFTLVELVVVIAILGILAAIAVPRFTNVAADAQSKADEASARTILSAISIAEASLQVTGWPSDTTKQNEFLAKVNASLNDPIAYGSTGDGWEINYETNKWVVYKDGNPVNAEESED